MVFALLTWFHNCWVSLLHSWPPVYWRRSQRCSPYCCHWSPSSSSSHRFCQSAKWERFISKVGVVKEDWNFKVPGAGTPSIEQSAQPGLGISPEMQLWPSVTDQLPSSLTFSQRGISSSSKRSRGSFPMKISQPLSGGGPSQPGGGPPYFLCPFSCRGRKEKKGSCIDF